MEGMLIAGVSEGEIEQNPMKFSETLVWKLFGFALLLPICWVSCCPKDEQKILLDFKRGLHDPSDRLKTWNDSTSCCTWEGIRCNNITKQVIQLNLSNPFGNNPERALQNSNPGVGSLSVASDIKDALSPLFDLKMLHVLDLSYNSFNGVAVPQQLPKLKYLQYLSLSNAGFVGKVPRELGNMSTLRHLDLSTNSYISISSITIDDMQMWIGNMRDLQELLLDGVNMSQVASDEWGKAISTMYSLRGLQMSNCMLSGPIPPSLANLTSLTHLQLGYNSFFSSVPATLQNLSNLVSLKLSSCELNGSIPSGLLSLPNLQEVDLSANMKLGGNLSSILPRHSASLQSLVLSGTSVGGAIPDSIGNISSLTLLDLSDCSIQGKLPPTIANLTELVMLDISVNKLEGSLPSFETKRPLGTSLPLAYIDLAYNQFQGRIPPMVFGAFENLRSVDLSQNRLAGAIPSIAMNLTSLTWLDLSHNELTGAIPSFANIKSLVLLDLSNNLLTGKIQPSVGQLVSLSTLDLSHNLLTGAIPRNISNLSKLKVFSLSSNQLSGKFSASHLNNLSSLVSLDISNNVLTVKVSPTWIPQNSFRTLKLRSCNMEGEFPTFLITQTGIFDLDLSDNRLWGNIPEWIWDSLTLQQLNLSYNKFAGALPSKLLGPKKLKFLDLHHNNLQGPLPLPPPSVIVLELSENLFSSSIPPEIGDYNFNYLSLSHNNLSGSIPSTICRGFSMQILDLSNNGLTGKIPATFANCSYLVVLNLESNSLEGELPAELGNMISLQTLKIRGNHLNGTLPTLTNCKQLQILDVGDNRLTGNISSTGIQELPNLKILVLRSNNFEGSVPADISKIPSLQILDLSMNSLTGAIPDNISEMKGMANESENTEGFEFGLIRGSTYVEKIIIRSKGQELEFVRSLRLVKCLDLSSNRISGHIPEGMGSLMGLIILNISRNHGINSGIPKSLGNMAQLESLDLSHNQLSGVIPAELVNLTYLSYLDLSYNNLSGRIPLGGQFLTFEASSFSNNPGLYGLQLNESWSPSPKDEIKPKKEERMNKNRTIDSFIVLMGMSFGVGAGITVAPLLFLKKWRKMFFDLLDNILIWVVDMIPCDKLQMVKISDEDQENSEASKRTIRFCVRCTQIDRETKSIVHTKCIC